MHAGSRISRAVCAAFALTLALGACAQTPPKPITIEDTQEVTATVQAIDQSTRMVTLRAPSGEAFTVKVDPGVRNLAQVKVGDRVVTRFYEALGVELKSRGQPASGLQAPEVAVDVGRARAGARPAGVIGAQTTQTVRINSVDRRNNTVVFNGADGLVRSFVVQTPEGREFLQGLKANDEVQLTYTEALAISVEPAK